MFYNRSNEAAGRLKAGRFRLEEHLSGGLRWFHSGGIFAALSATTPEVIIEGMQAAKAAGAVVSFDLNFREKLWQISGGLERAQGLMRRIMANVDVLVGNEEDLQKGLGSLGPKCASSKSKLDPSTFFGMMEPSRQSYFHKSRSSRRRCAKSIRPTAIAGVRSPGSMARRTWPPLVSSMCSIASAAATVSRPVSSMGCCRAHPPKKR